MPFYEVRIAFGGNIDGKSIAPSVGQQLQISEEGAANLVEIGYIKWIADDPEPPFDPAVFDTWTVEDVQGANLGGEDGLLAFAEYREIPLDGETKKDDVLAKVIAWLHAPVEGDAKADVSDSGEDGA